MSRFQAAAYILLLIAVGSSLHAQTAEFDIRGKIQLDRDPNRGVAVDLKLCNARKPQACETITLNPESTRPYWFKENLPEDLRLTDLRVRVEVQSPPGYVSAQPDYFRKGGRSLDLKTLLLKRVAEAYPGWIKSARDAGRSEPAWALRCLARLEEWPLSPEQKLEITMQKAAILGQANNWKPQQNLLRDAFPPAGFGGIAKESIANYFRQRFAGFANLITGDFATSVLQTSDLQELWERLVYDFGRQYRSCPLDAATFAEMDQLTPEIIGLQRKALKTWLGRPGNTVTECSPISPSTG